ncbi:lysoplasmalogenase [Dactylosporangium aurantiacum]|uniref:Lysoplasmalogenase n=1 Tax=Dactylosporangium aurantiacum TaxID=35754 RepID=A0A9Q9IG92_9ACTN|nr:lysoplasmalogenase [Dactylosporangium aurantiacum]MDG6102219.1 lysoplasmalogenase [Dactylosporangium aurantiacum]UWZ53467.1 lysoplasmalogenase [Dactylosporangium aurantiacum]
MRLPLWLFACAAAELTGVALSWEPLQWVAKPLLAPLLLWYLLSTAGRSALGWGLVFACAGDVALLVPGTAAFLIGMACFLGTQVCFLVAFLRRAPLHRPAAAGYAVLWAALNALLWPSLGALRVPILVYSLALSAMAAAAYAVSRRVAVGAALFLLSDLLIGLGAADLDFPGRDLVVMATYIAALFLITTGFAVLPEGTGVVAARSGAGRGGVGPGE